MRGRVWSGLAIAALVLTSGWAAEAQTGTPWLHVQVVEQGHKASKVHVNLPLGVVQAALELAPDRVVSDGRIHLHDCDHDLSVAEMRRLWTELKASGEAEWVTVEERDQTVSVARQGDLVRVRVEEPGDREQVFVEVPVAVVDALFSGEGEELNLRDAFKALERLRGDIVRVDEDETKVRIWIDEKG